MHPAPLLIVSPTPHFLVVVGFVCFDIAWSYAVEPLMPVRSKVIFQTKRDTGVYAARGRWRFASGMRLFIRRACASEPETALLWKRTLPL